MHQVTLVAQKQYFAHTPDHPASNARGALFHGRVQRVLRRQAITDIRRAQADTAYTPVSWFPCEYVIRVHRALCAIERADAEVNDADAGAVEFV